MKMGKQIALLVAVSLFAIAVAVAVVWFGNSTVQSKIIVPEQQTPQQNTGQAQPLADEDVPEPEKKTDEPEDEKKEEPEEPEPPENELLYQSLGNGNCCVIGPGGVKDACVVIPKLSPAGERVTKIASRAFFGCEWITALQIPETVREIGALAFADCKNLVYISVSAQNPVYCDADGVLYTADKRVLLQYPPMRAGDPLVLPASVTAISEMAFYGCKYLKSIAYGGSGEDWERIEIGSRNYDLFASAIRFASANE